MLSSSSISTTMASWRCPATLFSTPSTRLFSSPSSKTHPLLLLLLLLSSPISTTTLSTTLITPLTTTTTTTTTTHSSSSTALSWSETEEEEEEQEESEYESYTEDDEEGGGQSSSEGRLGHAPPPPLRRRRTRYRRQHPGEKKGITEEMRFVAMKLRNNGKPKRANRKNKNKSEGNDDGGGEGEVETSENGGVVGEEEQKGEIWEPSLEGFLKYLVDSKLVFTTIERIVDDSTDVSYVYLRKTGLERAECLSRDLEWFSRQGNSIPEISNPGVTYAKYLEELAEKSPPLFMSHFYNVYFSHIAGGQVIAKKVSRKLLQGRELEFFKWEGNEEELLRGAREKINMLGEHWSRDEKNRCLKETTKSFRFLGQIVRLIIS